VSVRVGQRDGAIFGAVRCTRMRVSGCGSGPALRDMGLRRND